VFFYSKGEGFVYNVQYTPYDQTYIDNFYRYIEEGTGRQFRVSDLMASGTRKGSSGQTWHGVDPNTRGNHWKYTIEKLEQLDQAGRIYWPQKEGGVPGYKRYLEEMPGVPLQSIWIDISPIAAQAIENASYATQKPESLLERIIEASSNEGDLVLDCFCGSGTTAAVAEKLGRRWITCDLGRFAIQTTRKRLLGIEHVRPFAAQNLGKYERQVWQASEFGPATSEPQSADTQTAGPLRAAMQREAARQSAYRRFVLDLYHADPIDGYVWLHGLKNGRYVHVGSVDAPVTAEDVYAIARECWKAGRGVGTQVAESGAAGDDRGRQDAGGPRGYDGGRQDAGAPSEYDRDRQAAAASVGAPRGYEATNAADVLGWDFAFEVNETAKAIAADANVRLSFKRIPREVLEKKAVEQGDIRFFELAALSLDLATNGRAVTVSLRDFMLPPDDVPADVQAAITHWSQWIDYWAVDWDFRDDTFHNQWQSYRTRKDPTLQCAVTHTYDEPGAYTVMVKVIDILGNDTTKGVTVEVT